MRNTAVYQVHPTAVIYIELDDWSYEKEVGVEKNLPEDVLLDLDIPR